jgi:two-component system, NtrC family, response regulator HydG
MLDVLVVDDDPNFLSGLTEMVSKEGFATTTAGSLQEARQKLKESTPDMVLLDVDLPDGSGMELLKEIGANPLTNVVIITGHATIDAAVEAMQMGASNYLTKPIDFARVKALLVGVVQTRELKQQIGSLRKELRQLGKFGPLIGVSAAMQNVYDLISKVAPTEATVMLLGETGTGKELVAETVHDLSRRRKQAFLAINCGAVSPSLIGSELFGHEKGSFTGADRQQRGYFEQANGGTLFLDEITEMPLDLQVDLLRVLETGSFRRVGGQQVINVDVRVIAATNVDPSNATFKQKLREDLLYRLNVFPIMLPPLRERLDDVELLAEHFLSSLNREAGTSKRFTGVAVERLRAHPWPGNVRELKNIIQRAFILAENDIGLDSLVLGVTEVSGSSLNMKVGTSLAEAERRLILATLEHCSGDKKASAAILGISLKTLYNRLSEYKPQ